MSCMSDFDDYPFSLPQNWGKHINLKKFFFISVERILETTFCQIFATINTLRAGLQYIRNLISV